ncbi:unnamed protein product [Echinostoma caproni]|uniref:Uncharacterized protein n=1 Tax=Echinostoma caproni TaxID=27848 RepID=A0A183B915_9TREM|nr:unnamed protein product [Echinostoma caproni]
MSSRQFILPPPPPLPLSTDRSSTKRRSQSAHLEILDKKDSVDKSVGPTYSDYNICYAPLRTVRNWEYKYRNILVSHWLPMAEKMPTSVSCEPNTTSVTSVASDDVLDTWMTTRGASRKNRKSNGRNDRLKRPANLVTRTSLRVRQY